MAGTDYRTGKDFKTRYAPIKSLGGGMSKVLLAEDKEYKRKVVVKFFDYEANKKYDTNVVDELALRFALETEVSAQLNHPNTVRVYETGTIAGTFPFITMEHIDGRDLGKAIPSIRESQLFKLDEFLMLAYEICDTIDIAHQKGIINRDLKPANILLGKYGALKVIDWGIAKILNKQKEKAKENENISLIQVNAQVHTMEGVVMGTEAYMAPEQRVGLEADQRTDIYLLAGIFYHAITGQPPIITARNKVDMRQIILPELKDIINTCMQTDPDNRYQTAEELKKAVKNLLSTIINEKYKSTGIFSNMFKTKKTREKPEPLILSDIVKKWAGK